MTDRDVDVEAALERVLAAARRHLDAVRAADGAPDDDAVWHAYVALNNAAHDYDDLLNAVFGEVTPWDVEPISADQEKSGAVSTLITSDVGTVAGDDPYALVISVRQRRDYRVPSVAGLIRAAEESRPVGIDGEAYGPIGTVAEAVAELMESGDGSLGMLDVPELDPLAGVTVVAEIERGLDPHSLAPDRKILDLNGPDSNGHTPAFDTGLDSASPADVDDAPFRLGPSDRVVHRFLERAPED